MIDTYREIFEKFPDGVTLHDPADGTILEANRQFCEMLGYSRDELLALGFEALHVDEPPYTRKRAEQYIRRAATEGPQTFEWLDETKDGERIPVEVNLRRTAIDGEQRILAVVRDITERKEREEELQRQNDRLEEFARTVSHDLRNPLAVAEGRIELARTECESEHLEAAATAIARSQALIDDLLALAREGDRASEVEPVDLATLTERCWENVATAGATLVPETEQVIRADETRLERMMENLIRNAVEHGGEGVTVTVGDLDDGFYVADDGEGIPADEREAVFDAGYSTTHDGTGFGLCIVAQAADAHGWELRVTDGVDGGARFEVTGVQRPV